MLYVGISVRAQTLVIEPSRTSGTAPLYVFFDATSSTGLDGVNDLPNADFSWDFDVNNNDPSGNWELTKGMVAGHVFEAPGIYTVSCTMIARNGTVDTKEVEITVSEFSGTTYYVAEDGDDNNNDGLSEADPWQTANFAFSQISSNERVLFKRGDTFTDVRHTFRNLGESNIQIGAYGSGEKPKLSPPLNQNPIGANNVQEIVISDLHIIGNGDFSTQYAAINLQDSTNQVLVLRVEVEGIFGNGVYSDKNREVGVFDCYMHDFEFRTMYSIDTRRMSLVGNVTDNIGGVHHQAHGIRIQRGEKQFVAHNTFSNLFQTKTGMTFRGDGQRHIMIYKNKIDRIIQVAPTSFEWVEHLSLATIEGNYIGQNAAYDGFTVNASLSAIDILATEVVVRNNVMDGMSRGITSNAENVELAPRDIDIYHNTMHWRPVADNSGSSGTFARVDDAENVTVRNNLMVASAQNQMQMHSGEGNINLVESDNLMTTTPGFVTEELPNSPAHENNASNYQLIEDSPAVNQGALDVPVYFDLSGGKRYYGSAPDVGAFEFDDGGEVTNPDPSEGREVVLGIPGVRILDVYPNPANRFLHFSREHIGSAITIFSLWGQVVKRIPELQKGEIDIANLRAGLYLLQVKGSETAVGKFIKN